MHRSKTLLTSHATTNNRSIWPKVVQVKYTKTLRPGTSPPHQSQIDLLSMTTPCKKTMLSTGPVLRWLTGSQTGKPDESRRWHSHKEGRKTGKPDESRRSWHSHKEGQQALNREVSSYQLSHLSTTVFLGPLLTVPRTGRYKASWLSVRVPGCQKLQMTAQDALQL